MYWTDYKSRADKGVPGFVWKEDYVFGYTSSSSFTKTGRYRFELNRGASAADAIQEFLKGPTIADCATAAVAIQYDTIRAAVGKAKFDDYFSNPKASAKHWLIIAQSAQEIALGDFLEEPGRGDRVPGDWYYFRNHPDYPNKHPRGLWAGEHVIYMGKNEVGGQDVFGGFGSEVLGEAGMLDKLLDEYNSNRTPEDLARLEEIKKENDGVLPPRYVYTTQGGTLQEKLEDSSAIVQAGGGLETAGGGRLSFSKIQKLIK
jgi:hypothetical protein